MFSAFWQYISSTFLVLAPVFLIALFISGLIRVFISRDRVVGLMGGNDLRSSCIAALAGIPIPLCSCSVLPVVSELRRKGASRAASASFLVTAPETGVDSISLTYALLGPAAAVFRPLAGMFSAIAASSAVIAFGGPENEDPSGDENDCCSETMPHCASGPLPENRLAKALRYGFVEHADEILYPLAVGLLIGGAIVAFLPGDVSSYGLSGAAAYFIMLAAGAPVYICASASTPIAAALILKGVSPGAAFVFLLAGPATNTAAIAVLTSRFGWRFTWIYAASTAAAALVSGFVFDLFLARTGFEVSAWMVSHSMDSAGFFQFSGAVCLIGLFLWRVKSNPATVPGWIRNFRLRG